MGHPEHAMSAALHALQPGASVAVKGPFGTFRYQPGKYKAIGEPPPATVLSFLACRTPASTASVQRGCFACWLASPRVRGKEASWCIKCTHSIATMGCRAA